MWMVFWNREREAECRRLSGRPPRHARASPPVSDQRDLLRKALAPIADEPVPSQLNSVAIIESPATALLPGLVGDCSHADAEPLAVSVAG
jgi:anti-sigma factor RsiW